MSDPELIHAAERDGVHVLYLCDLAPDKERMARVGSELTAFGETARPRRLLINFRDVSTFSALAVAKLLQLIKMVKAGGGHVECCGAPPGFHEVFAMLGRSLPFEHICEPEEAVLRVLKSR